MHIYTLLHIYIYTYIYIVTYSQWPNSAVFKESFHVPARDR